MIGEGNGNPLWYSCLENPVDRGVWQASVHGIAKSQTRLRVREPVPYGYVLITLKCGIKKKIIIIIKAKSQKKRIKLQLPKFRGRGKGVEEDGPKVQTSIYKKKKKIKAIMCNMIATVKLLYIYEHCYIYNDMYESY